MIREAVRRIDDNLRGRATVSSERLVGAPFNTRLDMAVEMLDAGESLVALENLCSNVYEYGISLTPGEYEAIKSAAAEVGMSREHVKPLAELV